ncbi:MAG: hypothetical protein JSR37_03415 [Verrucomicrobia bacterium]|nr:hypothetical protein [Verrucomicrobiota bacterium]MBS0637223.1 hypothetical protein [Verrucomicrobiota bacterium]
MRRFAFVIFFSLFSLTLFASSLVRKAKTAQNSPILLLEIVQDPAFIKLHADERMQIYSMLITAYTRSQQSEEQEKLLLKLLHDSTYKPYWISLKVSLGSLYLDQDRLIETSKVIKDLLRTPTRRLSSSDSALILHLFTKLEKHCEEKIQEAEMAYKQADYVKACVLYQYLFDAACQHSFIQTFSKQTLQSFLDTLTFRLATCYFLNHHYKEALEIFSRHCPDGDISTLYKGLIEKKLTHYDKAYSHFQSVQKATDFIQWQTFWCAYQTNQLASIPPVDSPFYADALHKRGLFYWKNKKADNALTAFFELESEFPTFSKHDEVLFFMGILLDKKGHDARYVFAELVHDHPESPFAPEAYYRSFAEQEYAKGNPQAISHLKKMPKSYLRSPFGIMATIYVAAFEQEECPQKGLSTAQVKTLNEIIESLNEALRVSDTIDLPKNFYAHIIRAHSILAECQFTLTNFAEAIASCQALQKRISALPIELRPHLQWYKTAFLKSRALLLLGNELEAREELTHMVEYAADSGFERSEHFILALIELAQVRAQAGEMDVAHKLLNKAEGLASDEILLEVLLEVRLAKSQLYRKEGQLDKAMMLLSSVINERSASSLRIQAMYLRAELYEEKGRRDLAFRQLQTTAKKGGEWAERAAKKLEEKYGYE